MSNSKSYKTSSRVVTQTLGKIFELLVRVGDVQCLMTFMIMDINNYHLLVVLNFLIKISVVVDVEKCLIQVKQGLGNNVQILPLNMVNMLQLLTNQNKCIDKGDWDETLSLMGYGVPTIG